MSEQNPFGEQKESFLSKIFKRAAGPSVKRVVKRREELSLVVPAKDADAVRQALDRFLAGYGVNAAVTSEDAGEGRTRLHASLGTEESAKLDLASESVRAEMERILTDAATESPG
jgi:hypothetical protein